MSYILNVDFFRLGVKDMKLVASKCFYPRVFATVIVYVHYLPIILSISFLPSLIGNSAPAACLCPPPPRVLAMVETSTSLPCFDLKLNLIIPSLRSNHDMPTSYWSDRTLPTSE